jgi:long-chain acyl-CoA synthetase
VGGALAGSVPDITDAALQAAVDATNTTLPDYARIARWMRGRAPFHADSGYATANGRPQRAAILAAHAPFLPADSTHSLLTTP